MRAVQFAAYGPPEVLEVVDGVPEPHAGPGHIRVRVLAASVNPLDWMLRRGDLRAAVPLTFPVVPGREAAGTVDEVGDGVQGVAVGDHVFGLGGTTGTYAQFAVLAAWAPVPAAWSPAEAAAAGLASATALHALDAVAPPPGATVVIGGAAGSVGGAATAFALDRGLHVIGTARARHHAYLRRLGVGPVRYGAGLAERVAEVLPGGAPGFAIDTRGGEALDALVAIVGDPGRVVTVCDPAGAERLGAHMVYGENDPQALRLAAELGRRGVYRPRIGGVHPFARAAEAHALAENGHPDGKSVLVRI